MQSSPPQPTAVDTRSVYLLKEYMWVEVDSEELHSVYVQRSYVLHDRQEYEEQLAYNPVLRILWILSDEVRCSNDHAQHHTCVARDTSTAADTRSGILASIKIYITTAMTCVMYALAVLPAVSVCITHDVADQGYTS